MTALSPARLSYAHGTSTTPLLGDTIGANLDRAVAAWPDREALVDLVSGRRWTYAAFGAAVDEVARGLLAKGVEKGDRVGIWAVNCPEWVLVQYATARIGVIMVNINPAYRAHELEYVLRQAGISVLVSSLAHKGSDYRTLVEQVRGKCPELRETVFIGDPSWDALTAGAATVPQERVEAIAAGLSCDDPVNIQYTSGTTGFPKGATLSHHNILNNGYWVGRTIGYTEQDRVCLPVPFYHCFDWYSFRVHATGQAPHGNPPSPYAGWEVIPCRSRRTSATIGAARDGRTATYSRHTSSSGGMRRT